MNISGKIKIALAFTMAFLFANQAQAQETNKATNYDQGFRLGVGLNGGVPTDGDYNWALGGDVRLQYDLSKKTSLTLTTGYTNLFNNDKLME